MFSVHLGGKDHSSHVTFGGVHSSYKFSAEKPVDYVALMGSDAWSVAATGLKWNGINLFTNKDKTTVFDLGLMGITLPTPEYNSFLGQLNQD